ncbi:MAG TPA: DUF3592 domain-containing protein [Steroidobacteraceae bacterium]|nr:DUF3592 domain-containing protein [Steroidobacteraceae bacterium]
MRVVACLIAAACLFAAALFDHAYTRSTPGAVLTEGTVVDFVRRNSKQVYPVFEFQDLDGRTHHVVNSTQQALFRFVAGDAVAIAYSRADPERARIDTFWFDHRWVSAALIVVITVLGGAFRKGAASIDS